MRAIGYTGGMSNNFYIEVAGSYLIVDGDILHRGNLLW